MQRSLELWIRQRAYELWDMSGREDGQDLQHWLTAEREVLAQTKRMTAATATGDLIAAAGSPRPQKMS